MKYEDIVKLAGKCIWNVEHKQSASVTVSKNYTALAYLFSNHILRVNEYKKPVNTGIKLVKQNSNPQATWIDGGIGKTNYLKLCQLMVNWVDKHDDTAPSYLAYATNERKYKIAIWVWAYAVARIVKYYDVHKTLPNNVLVTSKPFRRPEPKPEPKPEPEPHEETYTDKIFNHFVEKFGNVNSIDEALERIQGCGYGGYNDDYLSNIETIDNLANGGQKPNCTDIHQMAWHIGVKLGYDVRAIHVWCTVSQVGHVRLDFNHGDGWFSRDFSAVADGGDITDIWCRNGEFLAYDPDWFMENLYR